MVGTRLTFHLTLHKSYAGIFLWFRKPCCILFLNNRFYILDSADLENIDDGLESLCLSVTEHALSGE